MIRLFELRKEKGLSQRQMADRFNVSQGTYCNWEKGTTEPSIEQLVAMAKFFGVSVDYMVGNVDDDVIAKNAETPLSDLATLHMINELSADNRTLICELIDKLQGKG